MLRDLLVYDGRQACSLRKKQYSVGGHAEPLQRVQRLPACTYYSATARHALAHCTYYQHVSV